MTSRLGQLWDSYEDGLQYVVGEGYTAENAPHPGIAFVKMISIETGKVGFLMTGILVACEAYVAEDGLDVSWKRVA